MVVEPSDVSSFGPYRTVGTLVAKQCEASPKHTSFFKRRFESASDSDMTLCEDLGRQILRLAGDELDRFVEGYEFICDIQKREEIHFRRHGTYRLKTVRQAVDEVYGNRAYMQSYMRGLLMTQVFWANHCASMRFYVEEFIGRNSDAYDLLEIGPGHGLLFSRAASDPGARSVAGWDLSTASIDETREALTKLGVARPYTLEVRDLFDSAAFRERFDAVVFSEVLEHLEEPSRALAAIRSLMRPNGRLFINVPINSPAPDHLFLMRSPEEALAFVEAQGFVLERSAFFPATNYTLDAARKHALTISVCMVVAKSSKS